MKTEQEITARHQQNVEQEAVFLPESIVTDSGYIEIPFDDPILKPSTDRATSLEASESRSSEFNEAKKVLNGFARNLAITSQFVNLPEAQEGEVFDPAAQQFQQDQVDARFKRLSTEFQRTTELMSEHLPQEEQKELAALAYEALNVPHDEIVMALVQENRTAVEVSRGLSAQLRAQKKDIDYIETVLTTRKSELLDRAVILGQDTEEFAQIGEEVKSINAILKRHRVTVEEVKYTDPATPTTDELEKMYSTASSEQEVIVVEENETAPRSLSTLRKLAHKATALTVRLVHKK